MLEGHQAISLEDLSGMPAANFVMHRDPMLLLDTLVECDEIGAVCEWQVNAKRWQL